MLGSDAPSTFRVSHRGRANMTVGYGAELTKILSRLEKFKQQRVPTTESDAHLTNRTLEDLE